MHLYQGTRIVHTFEEVPLVCQQCFSRHAVASDRGQACEADQDGHQLNRRLYLLTQCPRPLQVLLQLWCAIAMRGKNPCTTRRAGGLRMPP